MNNDGKDPILEKSIKKQYFSFLGEGYWKIFGRQWPAWIGGLLLGVVNFAMFAYISVWFIYGGFVINGDWLISIVGIEPATDLVNPLKSNGWVHNLGIIIGAFIACLLASDFKIRFPKRRIRLVEGFVGGLIMGVGAMLSPGCNIGGYFSAIGSLQLSGFVMFFALGAGAFTGVLLARWRLKREIASGMIKTSVRSVTLKKTHTTVKSRKFQPLIGFIIIIFALLNFEIFVARGETVIGIYLLFGLVFGVILQRAGFCFTASFREIFTTGSGGLARGVIAAMIVVILGFSILIGVGFRDPFLMPLGLHTVMGGFIFGFGMVVAGGCATGTLFRIGEGNVQLFLALIGASLSASLTSVFLKKIEFKMGDSIWLVDKIGWQGAIAFGLVFMFLFYLAVQWNEMRRRIVI